MASHQSKAADCAPDSSTSLAATDSPVIPYTPTSPAHQDAFVRNSQSRLHRLPAEIREKIFEYAVTEFQISPLPMADENDGYDGPLLTKFVWGEFEYRKGVIKGIDRVLRFPLQPLTALSLSLVCRQFYYELEDSTLYRVNKFHFNTKATCEAYLSTLSAERRREIRHISISHFEYENHYQEGSTWETKRGSFWKSLHSSGYEWRAAAILALCPGLQRLTVDERGWPVPHGPSGYIGTSRLIFGPRASESNFETELHALRWLHGDHNPARRMESMAKEMEEITLIGGGVTNTNLACRQLEFLVVGSPGLSVLIDGSQVTSTAGSDAPYHVRYFERSLRNANHALQRTRSEDGVKNTPSDTTTVTTTTTTARSNPEPLPDLSSFRAVDPPTSVPLNKPRNSMHDERGLIRATYAHYLTVKEVFWNTNRNVIFCVLDLCLREKGCSDWEPHPQELGRKLGLGKRRGAKLAEPIARLATWDMVAKLTAYYQTTYTVIPSSGDDDDDEGFSYDQDMLCCFCVENPLASQVDAVLRATGNLDDDDDGDAHPDIRCAWEAVLEAETGVLEWVARVQAERANRPLD